MKRNSDYFQLRKYNVKEAFIPSFIDSEFSKSPRAVKRLAEAN